MPTAVRIRVSGRALLLMLAMAIAPSAEAQYFGQNKVQYKDFTFEVLQTEHFEIYFYPEERAAAIEIGRMAERWRARLTALLGHELKQPQPIVLYASHPDFQQTNVVQGWIGEGTGGVTEGMKRRVVLPLAGSLAETDHVLGHELVHAYQYDIAAGRPDRGGGFENLPLWFVEGMAEYLSIGHQDPHTAMWIRDAARANEIPTIGQLGNPKYFPYRWGQALWAYVAGRWGDSIVGRVFDAAVASGNAKEAFEKVLSVSEKELSRDWHAAIASHYAPVLSNTSGAGAFGRALTGTDSHTRSTSVSPALGPDGARVVYLSERDLLSIDLYLADADTGRVIRKLVDAAVDPHFTSLQFIGSAGSWHPNGQQFVFGAIRNGRAVLAIVDVNSGQVVKEIAFPALGEILNPTWSPDGRSIAFSATAGGYSDLFVQDVETGALRQLTSDPFADYHPAWSPEGRRLAFVTDRFSTKLSTLESGRYELGLIDTGSETIERVATFDRGKSINPQWSPEGGHLYFLSDQSGITNVYLIDLASGDVRQVTNVHAGVTGITALSPALSVPIDAKRLAFSAYDRGQLRIYVIDGADALAGTPVVEKVTAAAAAWLPPEARESDELITLLQDATQGLPPQDPPATIEPYRPRLGVDYVGQPAVSMGVNAFGPMFGGGLSFYLSDMLGSHNLLAGIDANTYGTGLSDMYKNIGGVLAYQNRAHRWNWGIAAEQAPYITGGFASSLTTTGGQRAAVDHTIIQRQIYRGLSSTVAYPFSQTRRLELGGGYQHVTFDQQIRTVTTSLRTGRILSDETSSSSLGVPLHLAVGTAAAVVDSSVFGATSPVAGQRSRLQISPTVGSLSFVNALADYRRYFRPASFYTIATRALHTGRYGRDGEAPQLLPLYLGYPELVRGYGVGSFVASECAATPSGSCAGFNRLVGSRMLVGNIEFRFPLLRPFGVRDSMYGPLPVEVAFFADGGVAWSRGERPALFGGGREGVSSAGITFRLNMFGFAVAQIDYAYPLQRPGRGWVWGFSLNPGF